MRYAQIRETDVANGVGIRVSLYVQGCSRKCKGCFNPETWDFSGGKNWTEDVEKQFLHLLDRPYIKGVTILGGEPLEGSNRQEVTTLAKRIKAYAPHKTIWIYTSYLYEELLEESKELLESIDVLVDGMFEEELKDTSLHFRGSSNQRVIQVGRSLEENKICLYN